MEYLSPDFYQITQESYQLPQFVIEGGYLDSMSKLKGIDICSGSGVIGLELLRLSDAFESMSFCELQREFEVALNQNITQVGKVEFCNSYFISLQEFVKKELMFDFIFCNPPYYPVDDFRLSSDLKRNLCRFQLECNHEVLSFCFSKILKVQGQAFICVPNDKEHGFKIKNDFINSFKENFKVQIFDFTGYSFLRLLHL